MPIHWLNLANPDEETLQSSHVQGVLRTNEGIAIMFSPRQSHEVIFTAIINREDAKFLKGIINAILAD